MFLHLGGTNVIDLDRVIAVLNLEKINFTESWLKEHFLGKKVEDISEGKPKALVITDDKVILSPISSLTLKKRTGKIPA